jgi:hypothetical protein
MLKRMLVLGLLTMLQLHELAAEAPRSSAKSTRTTTATNPNATLMARDDFLSCKKAHIFSPYLKPSLNRSMFRAWMPGKGCFLATATGNRNKAVTSADGPY